MTNPIPLTEFRENLTELLNDNLIRDGERLVIARNGKPFAVVMDIDEYEDFLELRDPSMKAMIQDSFEDVEAGRVRPVRDLIKELREELAKKKKTKAKGKSASCK